MKKTINLQEISARLAARYLARRGAIFVDSAKNRVTFPSNQMQHLERRAATARENALKRGFANQDEKEHIRVYRKTVKATNHAMRKLFDKATKKGPGPSGATAHDRVRDMLIHAEKERLDHALLVGRTPTIKMQVKKFANKPTTPPPGEEGPRFRGAMKKVAKERPKSGEEMPITHVEEGIPTQHHVVTSAGRVMFSGTQEQAHKQALRIGGDRGSLRVIESNHPKIKVGARLSSSEMKELEKQARKRKLQGESFEPVNELSNRMMIRYLGNATRDLNIARDAKDTIKTPDTYYGKRLSRRIGKRYRGIDRALNKLEKRGRIHPLTTTEGAVIYGKFGRAAGAFASKNKQGLKLAAAGTAGFGLGSWAEYRAGKFLNSKKGKELQKKAKVNYYNEEAVLTELSPGTLVKYAGAAEKSFRTTGLSKRAIGIKRAFRALRMKQ